MSNEVLLVRAGTYRGRGAMLPGRGDTPLSTVGRAQCHKLSASLNALSVRMVGHGPSYRTQMTARLVAYVHGLKPVEIAGLDDVDFGSWRGAEKAALEASPDWARWTAEPDTVRCGGDGETMQEVGRRMRSVLDGLPHHPDGVIVLVTHRNVIRAAVAEALGCSFASMLRVDIPPASITRLRQKGNHWEVAGLGLLSGHGLGIATDFGYWPEDREALGELWAPDGETRLRLGV